MSSSGSGTTAGKERGNGRRATTTKAVMTDEVEEPVKFILLAEFDIDQGATLAHQYPFPTGTDEHILAELMLPDGAHLRPEDWTIFYLNQTPRNAVAPVLAHESPGRRQGLGQSTFNSENGFSPIEAPSDGAHDSIKRDGVAGGAANGGETFTRTGTGGSRDSKQSNGTGESSGSTDSVAVGSRSGAEVVAGGTGTSKVDEMLFVLNCVRCKEDKNARRGARVKALAVATSKPYIQIYKPLLLLALEEYFQSPSPTILSKLFDSLNSIPMRGCPILSRSEMLILRSSDQKDLFEEKFHFVGGTGQPGVPGLSRDGGGDGEGRVERLGEDEPGEDGTGEYDGEGSSSHGHGSSSGAGAGSSSRGLFSRFSDSAGTQGTAARLKKSSRTSLKDVITGNNNSATSDRGSPVSTSHHQARGLGLGRPVGTPERSGGSPVGGRRASHASPRDTHFFDTQATWNGMAIPIRIPVATFAEEVGDYSIIQLVQAFTPNIPYVFPPPYHPQLHTSGANTAPIILLLNALLTQKRIIFLGHGRPAGEVANTVLAACALTGQVLRGFTERAYPYSNLAGLEMLEETPGYIAGVTNPRFEDLHNIWDVLCNLETGKITVSKELRTDPMSVQSHNESLISLTGSISTGRAEDDAAHPMNGATLSARDGKDFARGESSDSLFMDDVLHAINSHYGESTVRARFADYITRFVRLAARYEQDQMGSTKIDYLSKSFHEGQLGSGMMFSDEMVKSREMALNAPRIEGWRRSRSYTYWKDDFQSSLAERALRGFDLRHQMVRLRTAESMSDWEAAQIYRTLANSVQSYDSATELLAYLPAHTGGLMPLAVGLFHASDAVRNSVIEILNRLQEYPIGNNAVNSLNAFLKMAYSRLAEEKVEREDHLKQYQLASQESLGMSFPTT